MITRFPGLTPTRSRAVAHDDLVFTVAVAPDPVTPSMYEQSAKALARIDESLALCGTDKSKILSAIVYITDIKQKSEMNRAWDEWVDTRNPPMRACIGVDLEPPHIVEIVVTAAKCRASRSVSLFRVGLFAGLHQIEALLDLAEQPREIAPLLRGEA